MQRNPTEPRRDPRQGAERDAAQPMGGQPRTEDDEDALEKPEHVPSYLTARELQARDPAKPGGESRTGERHGSASFTGPRGEPPITDDEPPRGDRGLPERKSDEMLKKGGKPQ